MGKKNSNSSRRSISRITLCLSVLALATSSVAQATTTDDNDSLNTREYYEKKFFGWMKQHGITFDAAEEFVHRLNVFSQNDDFIKKHNALSHEHGYKMGHNEFSHFTWQEFKEHFKGLVLPKGYIESRNTSSFHLQSAKYKDIPESIDWVEKGAVTPVKNQGQCGSCWAFSTTGAVEGAAYVSSKSLPELSEQELVDCDHDGDMGCGGGLMDHAFKWIEKHGGICSESEYVYHAKKGMCLRCKSVVKVSDFHDVPSSDETALKAAVANQPVSVAIEADQPAFQFYKSGVFNSSCGSKLDHGVLVVGYGIEDGSKFWKVKNSWGPTWGEGGYIKLARELGPAAGQCGVASVPSFPTATVIPEEERVAKRVSSAASIEQCGSGSGNVNFTHLSIAPEAPVRGEPVSFIGKGLIKRAFNAAKFDLKVKMGGEQVYTHSGSMCGDTSVRLPLGIGHIDVRGFDCPASGSFEGVGVDVKLPVIAPPGNYEVNITGKTETESLFCINVKLELSAEESKSLRVTKVYSPLDFA